MKEFLFNFVSGSSLMLAVIAVFIGFAMFWYALAGRVQRRLDEYQTNFTNQASANAVHDFLVDLMVVERSVGQFTFFKSDAEINDLLNRLEAFFRQSEGR